MTQKGDIGILSNGDSISYKRTLRQKSPKFTALVLFSAACLTVPKERTHLNGFSR